jgi:hypothetical protein
MSVRKRAGRAVNRTTPTKTADCSPFGCRARPAALDLTPELRKDGLMVITVQDSTSSGQSVNEAFELRVPVPCTLRELIRLRVRDEVARYNASHSAIFDGLVCPDDATAVADGFRFENGWHRIDWERQADIAERAFEHNGFFVFVADGGQPESQLDDLDAIVDLATDAEIRFIRLVHLVGG